MSPVWSRPVTVIAALIIAGAALAAPTVAQSDPGSATVVPIQVTGDPSKRFNMVVMGDGYTAAELPRFREHLNKHLNVLWTIEPFKTYRNYINVYAVEIESAESGVDCDPDLTSPRRNTPLNMGFWGGCNPSSVQRLLGVDGAAANRYADMVAGTTRSNRQLLAIGNSDTYGGAGGTNATASGGNALSALITPHELGHSLGGLQDEYDYLARGVRGAPYTGGEPSSTHHTLLTEQQMLDQQRKWWRWLGERSESGGVIGRYESGLYSGSGVWRPSAHSMMKTLGYYFDQPSREQMTQRIAAKTSILQDGTPADAPIGADRVVWVETLHPVGHRLDVRWTVDGGTLPSTAGSLDLSTLGLAPGVHTLAATVVDPTEFIRDPAIRSTAALTRSRTWTVDTAVTTPPVSTPVEFTASTPTGRPVGGTDVVYVETTHPVDHIPAVTWTLDGSPVSAGANDRSMELKPFHLTGRHTLTATVGSATRTWTVDAASPTADYSLSTALLTVPKPGRATEYIYNGPFTMRLDGTDDTPGYVVREFQTDGDGWFNYFGWPTDPDAPFLFTPEGTNIDNLVYGKLGVPRLSPWDDATPSYGRHTVQYRAIDPSGNIGAPGEFVVTLLPAPPACRSTITGRRNGPLVISSGVTCLDRAEVSGPVLVRPGAALVASGSTIGGPVVSSGASTVELLNTTVHGPVSIAGTTVDVTIVGGQVHGPVVLSDNRTGSRAAVLAGATVSGPLFCAGNAPAPENLQAPNTVRGPRVGQCANL